MRIYQVNEKLYFEITDEGIGISKEKIGKVFDAFQQVDNSDIRKYQGAGLGLTICKKYILLLKGEIDIESEPNVGTKVKFFIPYNLGYGEKGAGNGAIPGFATLIFEVELLDVKPAKEVAPVADTKSVVVPKAVKKSTVKRAK